MKSRLLGILIILLCVSPGMAEAPRNMVGKLQGVEATGDDLVGLARRYRLAVEHLAFANGFPVTTVRVEPGTRVILPTRRILPARPPRDGLVINLPERGAFLFRKGAFAGFYPLSIGDEVLQGKRFRTPVGQYRIVEKLKDPTWYPPAWAGDRHPVGPGPSNPLGDRWIGLSLPRTGIHGTNDPLNVGNSVTHGCMRSYPELVRELYDRVEVGWTVRIEYETAKLGRSSDGKLYVVNFPDVYGREDSLATARKLLSRHGLRPGRANFSEVLGLYLGYPVEVKGTVPIAREVGAQIGW